MHTMQQQQLYYLGPRQYILGHIMRNGKAELKEFKDMVFRNNYRTVKRDNQRNLIIPKSIVNIQNEQALEREFLVVFYGKWQKLAMSRILIYLITLR